MELYLDRNFKRQSYTIGKLWAEDGTYLCDTIEDADRGLDQSMPIEKIKELKKPGITAIPTGRYKITLNVKSPKFSQKKYYKDFCNGYLPRLENVKGFEGILIHRGVDETNSWGCVIVGFNNEAGKVLDSKEAFEKVYNFLKGIKEDIYITIK